MAFTDRLPIAQKGRDFERFDVFSRQMSQRCLPRSRAGSARSPANFCMMGRTRAAVAVQACSPAGPEAPLARFKGAVNVRFGSEKTVIGTAVEGRPQPRLETFGPAFHPILTHRPCHDPLACRNSIQARSLLWDPVGFDLSSEQPHR